MIGFAITMLIVMGVLHSLAGFFGREMREDTRGRDEVLDPFVDLDRRGRPATRAGTLRPRSGW